MSSNPAWNWGNPPPQAPVVAPLNSQLNYQQHPDMQPAGPAQADPVAAQLRGMAVNKGVDMAADGAKAGWNAFNAPLASPYAIAPTATPGVGMVAAPAAEGFALAAPSAAPTFGMTAVAPATQAAWAAPAGVMGVEAAGATATGALAPLAAATEGLTAGMGLAATGATGTAGALTGGAAAAGSGMGALTGGAAAAGSGMGALGAAGSAALASNPVGWGIAGALAANQLLSGKGELGKITHGGK